MGTAASYIIRSPKDFKTASKAEFYVCRTNYIAKEKSFTNKKRKEKDLVYINSLSIQKSINLYFIVVKNLFFKKQL